MTNRWVVGAVLIVTTTFLAAACGSGTSYNPTSPGPTTGGGGGSNNATTISIVGISGSNSYSPNPASVAQGSTVVWKNNDTRTHRIVMDDGSLDTGNIGPGASSAAMTLGASGSYHCTIHPSMVGSINGSTSNQPPCQGAYCG
jgi:plastocyanin